MSIRNRANQVGLGTKNMFDKVTSEHMGLGSKCRHGMFFGMELVWKHNPCKQPDEEPKTIWKQIRLLSSSAEKLCHMCAPPKLRQRFDAQLAMQPDCECHYAPFQRQSDAVLPVYPKRSYYIPGSR